MRRWRWGSNHKSCVRQMVLSIAQRERERVGFNLSHDKAMHLLFRRGGL